MWCLGTISSATTIPTTSPETEEKGWPIVQHLGFKTAHKFPCFVEKSHSYHVHVAFSG